MPPKRTFAVFTPASSRISITSPGMPRHIGGSSLSGCGHGGLSKRDAAVVRRYASMHEHLEAVGLEEDLRALREQRALEAAARQRDRPDVAMKPAGSGT